jgi:Holliday junction resolvasome RuvABC endonuclease subunit
MTDIREDVLDLCASVNADLVALEGFAFGARGRAVFDIGGIGWVIRVAIHEAGIRYVEIPPAVLKRYATGRGNADKQAMQMAAVKRLGYASDKPDDNEVDALWLRALAMDAYHAPVCEVPRAQRDASVAAVTWPRLTKASA